jgi:hypothetical protein
MRDELRRHVHHSDSRHGRIGTSSCHDACPGTPYLALSTSNMDAFVCGLHEQVLGGSPDSVVLANNPGMGASGAYCQPVRLVSA